MDNTNDKQECPGCGQVPEELLLHHWGHRKGNSIQRDKYYSIEVGKYKYICSSCNSRLGKLFSTENPPESWEEQLVALHSNLWTPLFPEGRFPYITYLEGSIFFLYAKNPKEARIETIKEFLKAREPKTTSRGGLHRICRYICLKDELRPYEITKSNIFYGKKELSE